VNSSLSDSVARGTRVLLINSVTSANDIHSVTSVSSVTSLVNPLPGRSAHLVLWCKFF
jgi:hypothetical protein